ncbi:hypothetical protein TRFO_01580 [Tritrichomonas foetus]|uniref:Leucine Rich Repeat family protein n=1 Tax=Tritrichomonas foetus TaxID=1144522 RepID=A0A1J4JXH8_9EUKA|nr:hypothetical protein TRFO_01580 [Tritrichomonas foetus]|eukprot:OHT03855.1 hypothetical protein TRFO_01580 [Tritrichomonas foetus]
MVNVKLEPVIAKGSFRQIRKNEKEKERFCVITGAALYVCKNIPISKNLKICNLFALVDLRKFEMLDEECFLFSFKSGKISLASLDPVPFLHRSLNYLKTLLPQYHNAKIIVPPSININPNNVIRNQFMNLVVSYCHSNSVPLEISVYSSLKNSTRRNKTLKILRKTYSEGMLKALMCSLEYTSQIQNVLIGGKNFPHFYSNINTILNRNKNIISLHLYHYEKNDEFTRFINCLNDSSIHFLTLERIIITDKMTDDLINSLSQTHIKKLTLLESPLGKDTAERIFSNIESFKQIEYLSINNDKTIKEIYKSDSKTIKGNENNNQNLIKTFCTSLNQLILITGLTCLSLIDLQIDINMIFKSISKIESCMINYIDLSGNFCSKDFKGNCIFPPALTTIILRDVYWSRNSLSRFIGKQQFQSMVSMDLTNIKMKEDREEYFYSTFPEVPPSPMVYSIHWNSNRVSAPQLKFFAKYKLLRELSMNDCTFVKHESNDIFNSMLMMIQSLNLSGISLKKTMKPFKSRLMIEGMPILKLHQTLTNIDISDNAIGDEGIELVIKLLQENQKIAFISFDGSDPQKSSIYVNAMQSLANLPQLINILKPKNDIKKIASSSRRAERDLKKSWKRISENLHRRNGFDDEETESTTNSTLFSMASDSQSFYESAQPDKILTAYWDLADDSPFENNQQEWNKLSRMFSFDNITSM